MARNSCETLWAMPMVHVWFVIATEVTQHTLSTSWSRQTRSKSARHIECLCIAFDKLFAFCFSSACFNRLPLSFALVSLMLNDAIKASSRSKQSSTSARKHLLKTSIFDPDHVSARLAGSLPIATPSKGSANKQWVTRLNKDPESWSFLASLSSSQILRLSRTWSTCSLTQIVTLGDVVLANSPDRIVTLSDVVHTSSSRIVTLSDVVNTHPNRD